MKSLYKVISLLIALCIALTGCSQSYKYEQKLNIIEDNYRTYYEVFVYSFYDSNGDGIGDIKGLTSKLDYIKDLGFNGIWLMPIMPSTTYHKYDVIDYYNIDSQYGSLNDFKELIKECNKRSIKVIIDLVINHTSTKNEWFQSAVNSLAEGKQNKYTNYYNFSETKNSSGKYYPTGTGKGYYEAVFWDQMPDLNLANNELRKEFENIMKFWLDMGVEGFRIDAAKEFFSGNSTKNIEVLKWITDYCKGYNPNTYIVAEVWEDFLVMSNYYKSGIDSLFNFSYSQAKGKIASTINLKGEANTAKEYAKSVIDTYNKIQSINENAIDAPFLSNHDTARSIGFFAGDDNKDKMALGINLLMNGTPFVYYGEEIGMVGSGKDENKRAPMRWSDTNSKGITTGPPNMETQDKSFPAVDIQLKDKNSILNYVKRAVRIRNENPEIARGVPTYLNIVDDDDICAIKKTYKNNEIVIIYNTSEQPKSLNLAQSGMKEKKIYGYLSTSTNDIVEFKNATLSLPPYSIVILK